jgi:energy-coupling factor transporter ATP-binding protein EcfA2
MTAPALSIRDLRFAYPGASWSLEVPRFEIAPGEQVLLVGGSGRGQSTLLQVVAGLRDATGTVEVAGHRIDELRGAASAGRAGGAGGAGVAQACAAACQHPRGGALSAHRRYRARSPRRARYGRRVADRRRPAAAAREQPPASPPRETSPARLRHRHVVIRITVQNVNPSPLVVLFQRQRVAWQRSRLERIHRRPA